MLRRPILQFQALLGHHHVVSGLCDAAGQKLRAVEMEARQTRVGLDLRYRLTAEFADASAQALTRPADGEKHRLLVILRYIATCTSSMHQAASSGIGE